MSKTYGIGDLAREFGLTTRAIRFYEDKGLLSPTRNGQTRIYSSRDRVRLMLILRGKRLGFSLDTTRELMDLYDAPGGGEENQLTNFIKIARSRRANLLAQAEDIKQTLEELDRVEERCAGLLAGDHAKLEETAADGG